MKPFNLQDAIAGKPVITRAGRPAKYLCSPPELANQELKHIFMYQYHDDIWTASTFTDEGKFYPFSNTTNTDLMMAPEKHKVYCALVQVASRGVYVTTSADKETLQARLRETKYQKVFQTFELEYEL